MITLNVRAILLRSSYRYLIKHPWQVALAILGVALGVAVIIAIDLANHSAQQAFSLSAEVLTGKASHRIVAASSQGIDEKIYGQLRQRSHSTPLAPIVEGYAIAESAQNERRFPSQTLQIFGVDPFAEAQFRGFAADVGGQSGLTSLLTQANTALILKSTADRLGLIKGSSIQLNVNGQSKAITIAEFIQAKPGYAQTALNNVLLMDISVAQELLAHIGYLSRIEVIIAENQQTSTMLKQIQSLLPSNLQIQTTRSISDTLNQMTGAFQTNLQAMSLLALLVGMFLIYNIMAFSVIQRRRFIGLLRAVGVTSKQVLTLVIAEALCIGIIGTVLGLILGVILGQGLLMLVVRTINDLYFHLDVSTLDISLWSLLKGIALGLGATLLSSFIPAREALKIPPRAVLNRSHLEQRTHQLVPKLALLGSFMIALTLLLLLLPTRSLLFSFSLLFLIFTGYALMIPYLVSKLMKYIKPIAVYFLGNLGAMTTRSITSGLSRTGVAVTALTVAVATTIGVSTMVGSFRQAVDHWLTQSLRADIYISLPKSTLTAQLSDSLHQSIVQLDSVADISLGLWTKVLTDNGQSNLLVLQVPELGFAGFKLKQGDSDSAYADFQHEDSILISEPYAYKHQLGVGDTLALTTEAGLKTFAIIGVYYDYGSDQGVISMSRQVYSRYWQHPGASNLGVYLKPDTQVDQVILQLQEQLTKIDQFDDLALLIRPTKTLRDNSLAIFDQTFAITYVLRLLTILVAVVGIFSALMALQMERAREFSILRVIGLTPRQLWKWITFETSLMGLLAGMLAIPLGLLLSVILIFVINQRAFGWSMAISVNAFEILSSVMFAVFAAWLAGLYPAYQMTKSKPALALRDE